MHHMLANEREVDRPRVEQEIREKVRGKILNMAAEFEATMAESK